MALDLKKESSYNIAMYINWLETRGTEIAQFMSEHIIPAHEQKILSTSFRDQTELKLKPELDKINNHIKILDMELANRTRKKFPDLMSGRALEKLSASFRKEIEGKKPIKTDGVKNLNPQGAGVDNKTFQKLKRRQKNHDNKS